MAYPVLEVDPATLIGDEQLGTKPKVWFLRDGHEWLFKEARANTGEDWAEKIAAEVAAQTKIDAANVELAQLRGRRGSASKSFINRNTDSLVHGNELLGRITGYDRDKRQRQSDHTLENIIAAVRAYFPEREDILNGVLTDLAAYLVLDALIGNTDRHHENWGLVLSYDSVERGIERVGHLWVAPSFDHASSLGRELTDARRQGLLESGSVAGYVRRGRGGIYLRSDDPFGANPLHLVEVSFGTYPDYFRQALRQVAETPIATIEAVVEDVPEARITRPARDLAREILKYNHSALIQLAP
jgi:hypothetical protein